MADEKQQVPSSREKVEDVPETGLSKGDTLSGDELAQWEQRASEGEEEYELKLGQHFLKLADSAIQPEVNGPLAVMWLTRASKQGNEAATLELKKCLETSTGITDENHDDVLWCVNTSTLEKKIRYAARNMFHTINSAKKDVLSRDEYTEAIKKLTGGHEQKLLLAAGKKIGENISEHEFVKLLSRKVQGTLTLTSAERSDGYMAAGPLEKMYKYPKETAMVLGDQALEFASRDGLGIVISCVPTDQIYLLMVFFIYGFLTTQFLLFLLPLLIFYIGFATIIITTLQMFYKKKKLKEANALAAVLKQYDVGVDVDQTQSQYSWNSLTPYLIFFAAIPLVVISFSLADKTYIPCAEFLVLSCIFCGICFMAISDSHDLVTLLALFCGFLASLPVFFHNFPQVPVLSSMLHILSGSLVSFKLFGGLQLNVGIPSLCYAIIPVFFIKMAVRNSFQGMYRVLVPHLVCFFWFNLITIFYPFTTWFGLVRATAGYAMLPVLIPLSLFIVVIGGIYVFIKLSSSDMFGKIVITMLLACIPILLTQTKKLMGGKLDAKYGWLKKILMVLFAVLAIVPLIFVRLPSSSNKKVVELALPVYMEMCGPGTSADTVEEQIKCGPLAGTKVNWEGEFQYSKLASVSNDVGKMLNVFPSFIGEPLRCIYGKKYGECDDEDMSEDEKSYCQMMTSIGKECHVREHDTYTFNFVFTVVDGDNTLSVTVEAGHNFHHTLAALEQGDRIEVKGALADGLGTSAPKLKLRAVKCLSRELNVMMIVEEEMDDFYYQLFDRSLQVAINFFSFPLVEYVPHVHGEESTLLEE